MKCIVLIAAPAAGKGTIAKYVEEKYNFKHVSAGDLLRDEVKRHTKIGEEIKSLLEEGILVKDSIVEEIFDKVFKNLKCNLILDGMPRTLNQAKMLDDSDKKYDNVEIDKVIYIDIDKEKAISRIKNRLICENCGKVYNSELINNTECTKCGGNLVSRSDDELDTYINRYNTFLKETLPLIDYYGDKVYKISNNNTLEDVFKDVDKVFKGDEENGNN